MDSKQKGTTFPIDGALPHESAVQRRRLNRLLHNRERENGAAAALFQSGMECWKLPVVNNTLRRKMRGQIRGVKIFKSGMDV